MANTTHQGTHAFTGAVTIAGLTNTGTVTQTGNVAVTGTLTASSTIQGTRLIATTAAAAVSQAIYTVAAGVQVVNCTSTGAGGPFAITLGTNNSVNHRVTVRCAAYNTAAFAIASVEGTTTLDAANESASFIYDGTNWICTGFVGTTGPA